VLAECLFQPDQVLQRDEFLLRELGSHVGG
jgi:hypothetical protein